jgi:hypothetical protein
MIHPSVYNVQLQIAEAVSRLAAGAQTAERNILNSSSQHGTSNADMEKFYKRVHIKLIELERRRAWLLDQAGTRPSTWSSWEKYGRMPPADRALAIADALGVSVEYLVAGRETPFDFRGSNPLIVQINQQLMAMSEQQQRRVLTVVNTIRLEETPS